MEYPKYEKVNEHTIRIINEKADDIPLAKILETKKVLEEKRVQIDETLKNIAEILANADQLGIVPEAKDLNPEK
jgi:hypothetical protein